MYQRERRNGHVTGKIVVLSCLVFAILSTTVQASGSVNIAEITPASVTVRPGSNQKFEFNAENTTASTLTEYKIKLTYIDGLDLSNLTVSPPAKKAKFDAKKKTISVHWVNIAPGITMLASWNASASSEGRYTFSDGGLRFKIAKSKYKGTVNTAALIVAAADNTAPVVPTGLVASASDARVDLNWIANSEPDLAGYEVYRAAVTGGPYTKLTSGLQATTTYTDSTASNHNNYFYVITAVDSLSNASAYSSEVIATPQIITLADASVEQAVITPVNATVIPGINQKFEFNAENTTASTLTEYKIKLTYIDGLDLSNLTVSPPAKKAKFDAKKKTISVHWVNIAPGITMLASWNASASSEGRYTFSDGGLRFKIAKSKYKGTVNTAALNVAVADNTTPVVPTGLVASASDARVDLSWNVNSESDLAGYEVYRATLTGGPYSKLTASLLTNTIYTDSSANNGIVYFYVITAVDNANNTSAYSGEASAMPEEASPPILPAPTAPLGLSASAGDAQVDLNWSASSEPDLAGFHVYRATSSGGPYVQLTTSPLTSTDYTDSSVSNGSSYFYVITAINTSDKTSGFSNEVSATLQDTSPPAIPSGLSASAGDARVDLSWNANDETDLAGYHVYRSTIIGGPYTELTSGILIDTSYLDSTAINGTNYFYVVTAVDNSTNTSAISNEVSATPEDPAPPVVPLPAMPSGLSASAGDARVDLSWNANDETDLAGYHVFRATVSGGPYTQLTSILLTSTNYTDSSVSNGSSYFYVITAINTSDKTSGFSNEVSATLQDTSPPAIPSGLSASAGDARVDLSWNANDETDLAGYHVYRSTIIGGPYTELTSGILIDNSYLDSTAINDTNYFYVVTAVDTATNASAISNEVSATPEDPAPPVVPLPAMPSGLSASAGDARVDLSWSASSEPDLAGFHVYRATSSGGPYVQLTTSPLTSTNYTDSSVSNGSSYFYVITAINTSDKTSGFSNEVSATPQDVSPPAIPSGLSASAGDARVDLNWNTNGEPDLAGYHVYRATVSGGPYTQLTSILLTNAIYTDFTASNGTGYLYAVTAVDISNNVSVYSTEVSATPIDILPPQISQVQITDKLGSSLVVRWNTDEPANSQVEYGLSSTYNQFSSVDTALTLTHDITLEGLVPGNLYHFRVRSEDGASNVATSDDDTFFMGGQNLPPSANAGGPYNGTQGQPVVFDASASTDPEGSALTYFWNFGDGFTATGVNPSHTYSANGNYTVTLTVNDGSQDSAPTTSSVVIELPIVNLSGSLSQTTLTAGNLYLVTDNLTVSNLNIEPGVVVRFPKSSDGNNRVTLKVTGSLIANGTPSNPIRFTADSGLGCAANDWGGIETTRPTSDILLDNVIIECAYRGVFLSNVNGFGSITSSLFQKNYRGIFTTFYTFISQPTNTTIYDNTFRNNTTAILVYGRSEPQITYNRFESSGYSILLQGALAYNADPQPLIQRNSLPVSRIYALDYTDGANTVIDATENWWGSTHIPGIHGRIWEHSDLATLPYINFGNFLESEGGQPVPGNFLYALLQDTLLDPDTAYTALDTLKLPQGVTLTVNNGTRIGFSGASNGLDVYGNLIVQGTTTNPARFSNDRGTRIKGSWAGIQILEGAGTVSIDNAVIVDAKNGIAFVNASGSVSNSGIQGNNTGVYIFGASSPTIDNGNVIKSNGIGIKVNGSSSSTTDPNPVVQNNNIYNNSFYNYQADLFQNPSSTLDASNNWWGSTDLAAIEASIYDTNEAPTTAPTVNYQPIADIAPVEDRVIAPVLDIPLASIDFNPYPITGIAPEDSTVNFYINGLPAGSTLAAFDGSFNKDLQLYDGENVIYATATSVLEASEPSNSVTITLDILPPFFDGAKVTVSDPVAGQVTITGSAGATEGDIDVKSSNPLNGDKANDVTNSDGSFSLILSATAGDNLMLYSVDGASNLSPTLILTVPGTPPALAITITTPTPGSTVTRSRVLVSGTFTARVGIGINVNGAAAVLNDSQFFANNVLLDPGVNTVTATVIDSNGEIASESITLTYVENPVAESVVLLANPETGLAPMEVSFSLELEDGLVVTRIELDADSDGLIDQTSYDLLTPLVFTYDNPGAYTAQVTVYDDTGSLHTASAVIVVQNTVSLRNQVHAVYYSMLHRLRMNDIDGALSFFTGSRQDKYREIFSLLSSDLAGAVDELGELSASNISSNYAELIVTRNEDGVDYAYFIYLIRSEDGVWRIDGM